MIRLVNAHKKFGRQTIYDGIDASIIRGERIGLLGKNGAGKSTLFKVLMGQESLDSGELLRDRKCSIGYLSQEIHPLREGTVFENMLEPPRPLDRGRPPAQGGHEGAGRRATRKPSTTTTTRWKRSSPPAATRWRPAPRRSCWAWGSRSPSSTRRSPPSRAAGRCGWRSAACSPSSTTSCCSTSRRTTSTSSASSGSRSSSAPTPARS